MKFLIPTPLNATASRRTAKAALIATLSSILVTLFGIVLYVLYLAIFYQEGFNLSLSEGAFWLLYALLSTTIISGLLMLFIGIPCFIAARKYNRLNLKTAIGTGIFTAFITAITFGIDVTTMGQGFTIILFLFLLPYGLAIAWTFYHLVKEPAPNT